MNIENNKMLNFNVVNYFVSSVIIIRYKKGIFFMNNGVYLFISIGMYDN